MDLQELNRRLVANEPSYGLMVSSLRGAATMRMLAAAGYDFAIIDGEHGVYDEENLAQLIETGRGAGVVPIVRIPEIRRATVLKPLDLGAGGLLVPQVETLDQVRELTRHALYAPDGNRGVVFNRPHTDFLRTGPEVHRKANAELLLLIQIETAAGLENVEALAACPGIKGLFIGPSDLSYSLGVPEQFVHPTMRAAYERIARAAKAHGKICSIQANSSELAQVAHELEMPLISYGSDVGLIVAGGRQALAAVRGG